MSKLHNLGRTVALVAALAIAGPAALGSAALPEGSQAPDFTLQAALAGKPMSFTLRKALKKGPVVLYFFPAAFTPGCTIEANAFAEASAGFRRLHATVIGVTAGNIERVAEFSKVECRDKFTVAADPGAQVAQQYQSRLQFGDKILSDRTSYVIAPDGKILLAYSDRSPQAHITRTMAAVSAYEAGRKKG